MVEPRKSEAKTPIEKNERKCDPSSSPSLTEPHSLCLSLYIYHVFPHMSYASTLKIEATRLLKMLILFYQTMQCDIPEDSFLIVLLFTILV